MEEERQWDLKRIMIGAFAALVLVGAGYVAKVYVLDKLSKNEVSRQQNDETESVAGESVSTPDDTSVDIISQKELGQKIDTIKKNITNLTPEDVAKQEPVKKILEDVESLKASAEAQVVGGAKSAVCEQAKRIFCAP